MAAPKIKDFDTIVVPMREQGFRDVFLGERRWPRLRLSERSRKQLRFLAAYRPLPVCALTHIAEISGFTASGDGLFEARFARDPVAIDAIPFLRGQNTKTIQSPRFIKRD